MTINDLRAEYARKLTAWADWVESTSMRPNRKAEPAIIVAEHEYHIQKGYRFDAESMLTPYFELYVAAKQLTVAESDGIDAAILWKLSQGGE